MREVFGDSSRNGEWAAVRLLVDGDTIAAADAPGLERDLAGLTLLEAAAVGGEPLAADALANALGPVFRAGAGWLHDDEGIGVQAGVANVGESAGGFRGGGGGRPGRGGAPHRGVFAS